MTDENDVVECEPRIGRLRRTQMVACHRGQRGMALEKSDQCVIADIGVMPIAIETREPVAEIGLQDRVERRPGVLEDMVVNEDLSPGIWFWSNGPEHIFASSTRRHAAAGSRDATGYAEPN